MQSEVFAYEATTVNALPTVPYISTDIVCPTEVIGTTVASEVVCCRVPEADMVKMRYVVPALLR